MTIARHKWKIIAAGVAALVVAACTAPIPGFERVERPQFSGAIPLPPEDDANADPGESEQWYRTEDNLVVRNVTRPEMIAFLPEPDKATGAAVLILPGGAFQLLSMSTEGIEVAERLADRGIAAFVLKYRLNETPGSDLLFAAKMAGMLGKIANGGEIEVSEPRATADALTAMRMLDQEAGRWSLDHDRIGMIGFSAGAMTALNVVGEGKPWGPDFLGYIYGPTDAAPGPGDLPPMLAAIALDDELILDRSFSLVDRWREQGGQAELHVYDDGGHGFGLGKKDTDSARFEQDLFEWLTTQVTAAE